jgi:hypothetical protein
MSALTPEQRFQARLAEYSSVRAEWMSSRDAQQQTLQWTLAALAVLFAGILSAEVYAKHPGLFVALSALVVLAATFSQAIWFGEVIRMERAAHYLRGLEVSITEDLDPPLMWERWRAYPDDNDRGAFRFPKASPSILGGFALYGLLATGGMFVLVYAAKEHTLPHSAQTFATVAAGVTAALYLTVTATIGRWALMIKVLSEESARLFSFPREANTHEEELERRRQ